MGKTTHICQSVRGALTNWNKKMLGNMFTDDNGKSLTAEEAREYLYDQLAMGHEVIPIGECDNFDYKDGCQGHES